MSLDDRNAVLEKKLEVNPIDKSIAALVKSDQRRKTQILLLTASLLFDLLLSVALAYGWKINHELAIKAESNTAAIIRRCEVTNEGRANNKALWDYILSLPPENPRTTTEQANVDAFRAKVNETFAPDDCRHIVEQK